MLGLVLVTPACVTREQGWKGCASPRDLTGQDSLQVVFGLGFFLIVFRVFFIINLSKFCSRSQWSCFLWNLNLFFLPQKVAKLAPFQSVCLPNVTRAFDTLIQHNKKKNKNTKRWSGRMFGPHQGLLKFLHHVKRSFNSSACLKCLEAAERFQRDSSEVL